jgi:hypothetical protein
MDMTVVMRVWSEGIDSKVVSVLLRLRTAGDFSSYQGLRRFRRLATQPDVISLPRCSGGRRAGTAELRDGPC